MNKKEFEVLYNLYKVKCGRIAGSEGFFQENAEILHILSEKGYCQENGITYIGEQQLERFRIKNAIILAAGMSTRFAPVCFDMAKGLISVKGQGLIERQICQLREVGIREIILVVGYRPEQFEALIQKYNLKVVYNPLFASRNNYYSVYLCKKYLESTIITSSDLYFTENLFESHAFEAYYTSIFIEGMTEERGLTIDKNDKIIKTFYGDCHDVWVTLGYAYFSKRFSDFYLQIVDEYVDEGWIQNMFWADIQDRYLDKLYMYIKRCSVNQIHEFDYLCELKEFDRTFQASDYSPTMKKLCVHFKCEEDEIYNIKPLSIKGTSRYSCTFWYREEKFVYCTEAICMDTDIEMLIYNATGNKHIEKEAVLVGLGNVWKFN